MNISVIDKPKKNINEDTKINTTSDVLKIKEVQEIRNAIREHLLFIGTDYRNNIRNISLLGIGTSNNVMIDSKEIIRTALLSASDKVILVHNHPSNNLEPSKADLHITSLTREMLELFDIQLMDHIIVTEKDYISINKIQENEKKKTTKDIDSIKIGLVLEENQRLKQQIEGLQKETEKYRTFGVIPNECTENSKESDYYAEKKFDKLNKRELSFTDIENKRHISEERRESIFRELIDYVSEHSIDENDYYNALRNIIGLTDSEITELGIEIENKLENELEI